MKNLLHKKYIYFALLSVFTFQIHGASETPLDLHARNYVRTGPSLRGVLVGALALIGVVDAPQRFEVRKPNPASDSNFEVLAQKTYAEGAFGPGYPVTYRLVDAGRPYETADMVADNGATNYGFSYIQHGEFTEAFVKGTNSLELGYGNGYHADRMLDSIRRSETNRLSLIDISDSNTKNMREKLTGYSKRQPKAIQDMGLPASAFFDGKVTVYDAMDAQNFLSVAARQKKPRLYDTVGAFHVMHFFKPKEILQAIYNIHTILKPNGTFVITLSSPGDGDFLEYGNKSVTQPWTGSLYCDPFSSKGIEEKGNIHGMTTTILPAPVLAELLKQFGFEIVKVASDVDIYDNRLVAYEGVIARKVDGIYLPGVERWMKAAIACEESSSVLYGDLQNLYEQVLKLFDYDQKKQVLRNMEEARVKDLLLQYFQW